MIVWWSVPRDGTLDEAEALLLAGEFERAEELALRLASRSDRSSAALAIAFRAALRANRDAEAVAYVERMTDDSSQFAYFAAEASDLAIYRLRAFQRAESILERAARRKPDDPALIERRAFLFGLTGRSAKAEPLRLELVRRGLRTWTSLWLLCLGDDALENTELLVEINEQAEDPLALFAVARWKGEQGDPAHARALLHRAIARGAPVEAIVFAGRLAREAGDHEQLERLLNQSAATTDSAALWWLRGVWCEEQGQSREAIRCHAEAILRQPNFSRSLVPLGRLLEAEGNVDAARRLRERATDLALYLNAVKGVRQEAKKPQWERVVSLARNLSLITETAGWWSMGRPEWREELSAKPTREWLETHREEDRSGRVPAEANPLAGLDLSAWPLPAFPLRKSGDVSSENKKRVADSMPGLDLRSDNNTEIRWKDVAIATGLKFVFEPMPGITSAGPRMFEFTGGGVAVFDFDRDGYLDTWWTQGVPWPAGRTVPPEPDLSGPTDRLFRNVAAESWSDVTISARAAETGFGQGVAAGDLDGDGFPEIVVANIGRTVVHWNRGDGTFAREELPVPVGWSTSLAIADLTSDGHPDLYVVGYLGGPEVFTRTCPDADGHPHSCLPQHFPAEPDCFLRNMGDGTFVDETARQGLEAADGKGLGIAVADFSGDGRLDIFIANDTTPNFCHVRQPDGVEPAFRDEGMVNGLALNGEGRAQADMGIALDDIDGNGLFDLFVTKFFNETNTLSLQVLPGQFVDSTVGSGLGDSSLRLLGFGTRFVDADLDGRPDIVITNGHIDDVRHRGDPFEMRPQFYRNLGRGRFHELAANAGEFFSRQALGRGMAKGDWNHDGREDIFISHIGSPAALLQNQSFHHDGIDSQAGWVSIELVGVKGTREPVGATVEIAAGGMRYVKVLAAGDGYLSSDPRRLTFGLRAARTIEQLTVTWPGGVSEQVTGMSPGRRWLVVEGKGRAIALP